MRSLVELFSQQILFDQLCELCEYSLRLRTACGKPKAARVLSQNAHFDAQKIAW